MGAHVLKHLKRMTLVFACLRCDQYTVANVQNLHVLSYHRKEQRLPFAALLRNDVGLFSEEAGEVAFSLLARSTLGDSVEDKHKFMTDCFCSLGAMRSMQIEYATTDSKPRDDSCRTRILQNDPEVLALQEHFLGVLRALEDGSFSYYATSQTLKRGARFKGGWTSAISGRILFEPGPQLSKMWDKVSDLDRDWGQQFAEDFGFNIAPLGDSPGNSPVMAPSPPAARPMTRPRVDLPSSPEWMPASVAPISQRRRKGRGAKDRVLGMCCFLGLNGFALLTVYPQMRSWLLSERMTSARV